MAITIETEADLLSAVNEGVIYGDVCVSGNQIKRLTGLKTVKGKLSIASSSCISLGDLCEVEGDFWLWCYGGTPKITSLENLTRVGGELEARSVRLKDIGKLEYVGGDCKFNGSAITDLKALKYVGGELYLPTSFKFQHSTGLSSIQVCGRVRFFKSSNIPTPKRIDDLTDYEGRIPKFNVEFDSNYERKYPPNNKDAVSFFGVFKKAFLRGKYYNVDYNLYYVEWLINDFFEEYKQHKTIPLFLYQLDTINEYYGYRGITEEITRYQQKVKSIESTTPEERLYRKAEPYINLAYELRWYEILLKKPLMNASHGIRISKKEPLTRFGIDHLEEIKPIFEELIRIFEKKKKSSFLDVFFSDDLPYKNTGSGQYNPVYYRKFYHNPDIYNKYLNRGPYVYYTWDSEIGHLQYGMVEHAVRETLADLLKKAENIYRESLDIPRIEDRDKGPVREKELYAKLASAFPGERFVLHGRPKWLGNQHIDVYSEDHNFGIEYHGLQHYQPVDYFGGEEGFEYLKKLDEKKKQICKNNNCEVMYVNESTPDSDIFEWVKEHIS